MVFNRIMLGAGVPDAAEGGIDSPRDRTGGAYIPDHLRPTFTLPDGRLDFAALGSLPTIFMNEGMGPADVARLGTLTVVGGDKLSVRLHYQFDLGIPPISQAKLTEIAAELALPWPPKGFSWTHTSWRVVDGDLFRAVIRLIANSGNTPSVFTVTSPPTISPVQISAMMPFEGSFTPVYEATWAAANLVGLQLNRADNVLATRRPGAGYRSSHRSLPDRRLRSICA